MLGSLRVEQPRRQRLQKRHITPNQFRLIGQKKAHLFWSCQERTCDIRTSKVPRERKANSLLLRWGMEK